MKKSVFILPMALLLALPWAQADEQPPSQTPPPTEQQQQEPEAPTTLIGRTQARRPVECRLIIHRHGLVEKNQTQVYEAVVTTDDTHEGQGHDEIVATPSASHPRTLDGQNAAQTDRITIFLPENQQDLDVTKAHSYNLLWRHGNHNHTTRCRNLVKQEPPETPSQP